MFSCYFDFFRHELTERHRPKSLRYDKRKGAGKPDEPQKKTAGDSSWTSSGIDFHDQLSSRGISKKYSLRLVETTNTNVTAVVSKNSLDRADVLNCRRNQRRADHPHQIADGVEYAQCTLEFVTISQLRDQRTQQMFIKAEEIVRSARETVMFKDIECRTTRGVGRNIKELEREHTSE
jgi:hypothetical protein